MLMMRYDLLSFFIYFYIWIINSKTKVSRKKLKNRKINNKILDVMN